MATAPDYYQQAAQQLRGSQAIYDRLGSGRFGTNFKNASTLGNVAQLVQKYFGGLPQGNGAREYLELLAPRDTASRAADITAGMQPFMNAFDEQVIDQALTRLGEGRDQAMSNIGAGAAQAGAFGGSRHALLEAKANEDYMRAAAETTAGLKQQSFAQAMQQALGIDQASDMFNLNRAGQFMAGEQMDLQTALAQFNSLLGGKQVQQAADQLNLAGDQFDVNTMLQAALGRANTSNTLYDRITGQEDRLWAQGAAQQQMNQGVLNAAQQQFQQYLSDPYKAMEMITMLNQSDPRLKNVTQTGTASSQGSGTSTQTVQPGFFDYLSLALQGFGAGVDAGLWGNPG